MVFVKELLSEPTGGMTPAVAFSWVNEPGVVVRTSPLVDKIVEGEREATSLRVIEVAAAVPSVTPDDMVGIAVWVLWLSLTGFEIKVVLVPEGDSVWVTVCGDVCTFDVDEGGGDVTAEKVSVTWETELTVSDPLVVPVL